ncbi:MAG: SDR family NAD(P)-dependent oxidoreductase [Thermoanaerobaculia bacterium]|nr:SDR family NAD(P)-dependent oxidoreductase [Thermoanaerobaculia bacterium]
MDRHVAVTGASSGLGEAIARAFGAAGDHLTLVARRSGLLEAVASAFAGRARVAEYDLATSDPAAWLPAAEAAFGPVDVLVNAAGCQVIAPFADVTPAAADEMTAVNFRAPVRLVRAVLPSMRARGVGAIVNISSIGAAAPPPYMSDYVATKAALAAFSESLGAELRGTGVNVLTVYPGPMNTPMGAAGLRTYGNAPSARMMPMGDPAGLALAVLRAVDRRRPRLTYPRGYALMRWLPPPAGFLVSRFGPRPVTPSTPGTR